MAQEGLQDSPKSLCFSPFKHRLLDHMGQADGRSASFTDCEANLQIETLFIVFFSNVLYILLALCIIPDVNPLQEIIT